MRLSPTIEDRPEEAQVFSFVQILSAIFGSFVHGANDVSNAIGPVVGLWLVAISGDPLDSAPAPIWILFYGGIGISIGLWMWGRKVMETVGTDLTTITPSRWAFLDLFEFQDMQKSIEIVVHLTNYPIKASEVT